ncbi:MAG: hypothetical protein JSW26_02135 [Desulfobacterales bacterium]|nr:MAG: hypothetical protein JSW26_02135 [Desulfobacterales bacterium]
MIKILFRGDPFLINTYHTLCQPEGATAGQAYAVNFIDCIVSEEGQQLIRSYGEKSAARDFIMMRPTPSNTLIDPRHVAGV